MSEQKFIMGIDQGTTGTRTLILDEQWNVYAEGYTKHTQYYPQPGWVEHDAKEIWEKTKASVQEALDSCNIKIQNISVLGLANQGETVVVWDRVTGEPVSPAIVWQDRRVDEEAEVLKAAWGDVIKEKTGVLPDSYFSALKVKWILDHTEDARERAKRGELLAGTLDTWLVWKMTGGKLHLTDPSTATRTMLFNIHEGVWDQAILDKLMIPKQMLAEIRSTSEYYTDTDADAFLGGTVPIGCSIVDQQAALFGQACLEPGMVKTTYGTGCFMLMNTGESVVCSSDGLLSMISWKIGDKKTYSLEGGVYVAGTAINWLKDGIHLIDHADEADQLAKSVRDNGGVYFVPAFTGLAAPHWDPYASGMMIGITSRTSRGHIVRATMESIAFQVKDIFDVMKRDASLPIDVMRVDGGIVHNDFLMQFQADLLGIPIDVPEVTETTALGTAYLAAMAIGEIESLDEVAAKWKLKKRYTPQISDAERKELMRNWRRAVERSKGWKA